MNPYSNAILKFLLNILKYILIVRFLIRDSYIETPIEQFMKKINCEFKKN